MRAVPIQLLDSLENRVRAHALVAGVDLVVIRYDDDVSVLYGCCARLPVDVAAERLARFFGAAVDLLTVVARAAGHRHLSDFNAEDLTSFKNDMCRLTGVAYGGVSADREGN
jgi:hypothetical protein